MPKPGSHIPVLRPPQFGLRTLLVLVAIVSLLAALSQWLTPIAVAAVILLILSIAAHMAGTSIGTRLREIGSAPPQPLEKGQSKAHPRAGDFAPATKLSRRHALGWPIVIVTLVGMILGGIGGGLGTLLFSPGHVGPFNVTVGVVAFSVLGGLASFVVFGFVQVLFGAIRQAMESSPQPTSHGH
jgi:hypothetical protein